MTVEETLEQNGELECPHGCGHMMRELGKKIHMEMRP
jgi:hypothetical protein